MADDRRAAIEAAFDAAEELPVDPPVGTQVEITEPIKEEPIKDELVKDEPVKDEPLKDEPVKDEKIHSVDKPPQSWRAAQKTKWATLEPDVRQEIIRRERETEKVLSESSVARQIAHSFYEVAQPYMARIQAAGLHPVAAAQELFKTDYLLYTTKGAQQAQLMAKLITDYGVDIAALDAALSGAATSVDPVQSTVDKLLQERLAPFMSFIEQQTQQNRVQQEAVTNELASNIEKMTNDPKFPEFDNVREDMADIIEISSKKGLYLTLEQAYTRAIAMNPEVSQRMTQQAEQAKRLAAAKSSHSKAQRALAASKSVDGAPETTLTGANLVNDRRATIAAAFDQLEGR